MNIDKINELDNLILNLKNDLNNDLDKEDIDLILSNEKIDNIIINKYKSKILKLLNNILINKNVFNNLNELDQLDELNINIDTYNIIFQYFVSKSYNDYNPDVQFNLINLYFKDVNNYSLYTQQEQKINLLKHSKYSILIQKYKYIVIGQYFDIINEIASKNEFKDKQKERLLKYLIRNLNILFDKNKLIELTDKEIYEYLYKKVKNNYCKYKDTNNNSVFYKIDIYNYNKKKITKEKKEELINNINLLESKRKKIRKEIASHNLKLVISVAKGYIGYLPFEDLIQEGNIGLLTAIDKFDPSKNIKFSTYATWWIRQSITRALTTKSRLVRLPVRFYSLMYKYNKFTDEYNKVHGQFPSIETIKNELKLTDEEINYIETYKEIPISINSPIKNDEDDDELGRYIKDEKLNIENQVINNIMKDEVISMLKGLPNLEKSILLLRFGIILEEPVVVNYNKRIIILTKEPINSNIISYLTKNNYIEEALLIKNKESKVEIILVNGKIYTLVDIGKVYGVSRESIRQKEGKALKILRQKSNTKKREFLKEN